MTMQEVASVDLHCPSPSADSDELLNHLCDDQLVFDDSVMRRTVVTDFSLVCARGSLVPLSSSTYMAGVVIVNFFAGSASDHLGRRRALLAFATVHLVASYLTTLASSYWFYVVVRYLP